MAGQLIKKGRLWHYRYSHRGRAYQRSSRSESRKVAERMLAEELKRLGSGYRPDSDRLTFGAMVRRLVSRPEFIRLRAADRALSVIRLHLRPFFGDSRACEIDNAQVGAYQSRRLAEGAAPGTVDYETAVLRHMMLVCEVARRPKIAQLLKPGHNARRDFLDRADFETVMARMQPRYRLLFRFLRGSGWRQAQAAALQWRDVDLRTMTVTARLETTKNGRPHTIPLVGELADVIRQAAQGRRLDCPFVFHVRGRPISFRGGPNSGVRRAWAEATAAAGFRGYVVHCLRRSAVRDMIGAGVDPLRAMAFSGHRDIRMFARYNIVTVDDLRKIAEQTESHARASRGTARRMR